MEKTIGLIGAMPEELQAVVDLIEGVEEVSKGMRTYYVGTLHGIRVVAVFSRSGKVAAATTVCTLLMDFGVDEIIFTGVAGGVDRSLSIGDVVIGERLVQHDVDARPVMAQYEIPLLGKTYFHSDTLRRDQALRATQDFLVHTLPTVLKDRFHIPSPQVVYGDIASGDQFFSSEQNVLALGTNLPTVKCVEMEGAAVAQVCFEYGVPFTVIRTISDGANEDAPVNFMAFIQEVASLYSTEIIRNMFDLIVQETEVAAE
jgi:adenosylhomocysteine nucleosidase